MEKRPILVLHGTPQVQARNGEVMWESIYQCPWCRVQSKGCDLNTTHHLVRKLIYQEAAPLGDLRKCTGVSKQTLQRNAVSYRLADGPVVNRDGLRDRCTDAGFGPDPSPPHAGHPGQKPRTPPRRGTAMTESKQAKTAAGFEGAA